MTDMDQGAQATAPRPSIRTSSDLRHRGAALRHSGAQRAGRAGQLQKHHRIPLAPNEIMPVR